MAVIPRINRNVGKAVTANYQVGATDRTLFVDTSGGPVVVTLANAADVLDNEPLCISWSGGSNALAIAAKSGETLEGLASVTLLAPGESRWIKAETTSAYKFV